MAAFTDKMIAALRPKAQRYEKWEGGGFGIRVTPRGIKSWVWVYRYQGKARRMTFGTYPSMGLADAHIKLAEARKALAGGEDPGAALVDERREERQAETIAELLEEYLEKWARPRKRSVAEDERILRKDVMPAWGKRKAKDIRRKDVISLLDGIMNRGAPIAANRTLAIVRKMFNWAISRDIIEVNPCYMVKPPAKERPRERVLTTDEIRHFWEDLDKARMEETTRQALRFQLVTGQRKGEVVTARWDEIDGDVWTIPPEKTKNGMAHRVPLSAFTMGLLEDIKAKAIAKAEAIANDKARARAIAKAKDSPWLFPSPVGEGHITGRSIDHALRNNLDVLTVKDARPHDLRRTAASHMTSIGISRLVVGKILNHVEPGVTAVYDRHSYDYEKRQALEVWARRLEEIITDQPADENVVALVTA